VTETKGDDVEGYIKLIREKYPDLAKFPIGVWFLLPIFKMRFRNGWEKTVARMIEGCCRQAGQCGAPGFHPRQCVAGLPYAPRRYLDELRTIIEDFGLEPSFLPDLAGSLDGHIPDEFHTDDDWRMAWKKSRQWLRSLDNCDWRANAPVSGSDGEKSRVFPYRLFDRLCGLSPNDDFIMFLSQISGARFR